MKSSSMIACALGGALLTSGPAHAQVLIQGLTRGGALVTFLDRSGPVVTGPTLSGLGAGEVPLSLDVRPFTGELHLITRDAAGVGHLYTVDRASGVATPVLLSGAAFQPAGALDMDFNPAAVSGTNALRVVTSSGQNFRLVFTPQGATVNSDAAINGGVGGTPRLVATAYTRNVAGLPGGGGVGGTVQYALDAGTDTLYRVNPPNNGTLTEPKALGLDLADEAALDVVTGSDRALALLRVGEQAGLYEIDLGTGQPTLLRSLPADVVSLAAALPVASVREPAVGLASTNRLVRIPLSGGPVEPGPAVSGLGAGEQLVAIDFRPRDGQLYGVTRDEAGLGRLYTLEVRTGEATAIPLLGAPLTMGASVGIDFNPVAVGGTNALRILSSDGTNYRLVFGSGGATVNVDGGVNGAGDGVVSRVVATAYTNNRGGMPGGGGAGGTVQYALDAATASLHRVNPPNNGTLTERRALPVAFSDHAGLDVITGSDRLLALLEADGRKGVYELDGKLGLVGWVREVPSEVLDLAVPVPVTVAVPRFDQGAWTLAWSGGVGPFEILQAASLGAPWERVQTTGERSATVPAAGAANFWRVQDRVGENPGATAR